MIGFHFPLGEILNKLTPSKTGKDLHNKTIIFFHVSYAG
jgi:hypothetical protein